MKVYAVVCEYYEEATGEWVSNILDSLYFSKKGAERVAEVNQLHAPNNHFYMVIEKEVH